MTLLIIAAVWGFAEATLFFVVPDVLISFVALRNLKRAMKLVIVAAFAATLGGTLMYLLSASDPAGIRETLTFVPAISDALVAQTDAQWSNLGLGAVLLGGISGTPFKIYATLAPAHAGLPAFVAAGVLARTLRFSLAAVLPRALTWSLERLPERIQKQMPATVVLGAFWVGFYAWYWTMVHPF